MLSSILLVFICTGACHIPNNEDSKGKLQILCEEGFVAVHDYKVDKFLVECNEGITVVSRGVLV
jgi:hypothetical protein